MALAVAVTNAGRGSTGSGNMTVAITGGTAAGTGSLTITDPSGAMHQRDVTLDGSGAASPIYPLTIRGTYSVTFAPAATGAVTTTAKFS